MQTVRAQVATLVAMCMLIPNVSSGANHREAPITALDRAADITDWYAFLSYDDPTKVTFILNVDPLLDPSNGPNYFPFDPEIVYAMKIDNDHDAVADLVFEFRFQTEVRAPGLFTGFLGAGNGINSPANAPATLAGGRPPAQLIPAAITALDGAGSEGLSLRQTYTVTLIDYVQNGRRTELGTGRRLIAVPSNVGARTMPEYPTLAKQGIYDLGRGMRVFAGTVDDPFYIDLGGTFDSLNFRGSFPSGTPGVLTPAQDQNDTTNFGPDAVAGFNVNTIALEIPINMVTRGNVMYVPRDPRATIGTWATTSRPRISVRRSPNEMAGVTMDEPQYRQVQRMGNPLINEVIIGTGSKDRFSMSDPADDAQFANFALDPLLARALNAVYGGLPVPATPRTDLLPLVQYRPPIASPLTPLGPIADLLRLNTGVPSTPASRRSRLGAIAGDLGGFPNGRRVSDDVTDIAIRVVAGVLAGLDQPPHTLIGDGVNANDVPYQETFPYVAWAQSGRPATTNSPAAESGQ